MQAIDFQKTWDYFDMLNVAKIFTETFQNYKQHCKDYCTELGVQWSVPRVDFEKEYFKEKMREYRARQQVRRNKIEQIQPQMQERKQLNPEYNFDLIDSITKDFNFPIPLDLLRAFIQEPEFDLEKTRISMMEQLKDEYISIHSFNQIYSDKRRDIIFKFITSIFMRQEGLIDMEQREDDLYLKSKEEKHENKKE